MEKKFPSASPDVIHQPARSSIYIRTDYIVNLDMSIPYALSGVWQKTEQSEEYKRPGLPSVDRAPQFSILAVQKVHSHFGGQ